MKIWEAWIDRSGYLTFKLKIDGSDVRENELADKTDTHIFFKEYPEWSSLNEKLVKNTGGIGGMGTFSYLPLARYPRAILGSYAVFVHYFEVVSQTPPKSIKLRLGTVSTVHRDESSKIMECKETMSDIVLTFCLDENES